jgi:class 3 adenylate cyclase/tetratricopeptide (TPR) repeat protein
MPICPQCGEDNPKRAKFCLNCATPLQEAQVARSLEERKVITVVFCDLVGFTARAEQLDPEEVRAVLAPYHAGVRSELERFGGTVEKFIGDAVMALFGAPTAHEDDPERAVRAALAIRDWIVEERGDLHVRIAVNTGEALVSLDSRPREGEAMAAGDVVNSAQRIQTAAPVNGILVGEQAYRATRDAIEYREAKPVAAKGKAEPIPVWEALEAHSRFGLDLPRLARTPLVGRQRELDLLVSALARVREERSAQLVTLIGVPGIGKSRLVFELLKVVEREREGILWRQGRCLPYGDGVSFWALGEMVKAQAQILESDGPEQAGEKLRRAVTEVVSDPDEVSWVEQQLRPLVGVGGELGSGERAGEAFAAWRRFLGGLAETTSLVLAFEDLHWADEGLLDFVDELADRMRDAPILILCTARPELLERRPAWGGGKANALALSLPPLSNEETARVLASALEQPVLEAEVQEALLTRAAGNPLYAEQFARVLAEIGTFDELPGTVHGVIAARLDSLLPQEKALLQDAAVVGRVFWPGALTTISDVSGGQAEEHLFGLERKEFVQRAHRSSVASEPEYAFRHVLLRDVAYGQIPRADRVEKHRRAAKWIESLGRPEDHAEMLAHHYLSALEYAPAGEREDPGLTKRARRALRAAGDRALALASYAAAARFYSAALKIWPDDGPDRAWLLVHAGRAREGADVTGIDLLEQGFEKLRACGDADGAAEVAVDIGRAFWFRGDRDAAYFYTDRALELAEGRPESRAGAYARVARAAFYMIASESPEAIRLARETVPLVDALGIGRFRARVRDVLGSARGLSGDIGGLDDLVQAIAIARESNAFYELIVAEHNLQMIQFFLGRLGPASETLEAFRRDVESYGAAANWRVLRVADAHQGVLHGQWDDAARALAGLIAEEEAGVAHYLEATCRALRASIELARGDLEGAAVDSEAAVDRARRAKDPQILTPALVLRGIVLVAQGRHEQASELASEVLALGSRLVAGLLQENPAATPIEFAWLLRDLGREAEFFSAVESAPSTPWIEAAKAIAGGDFHEAVELVPRIGAPVVEAYTRLRAAEELARSGQRDAAREQSAQALSFFRKAGATHYIGRADLLASTSPAARGAGG